MPANDELEAQRQNHKIDNLQSLEKLNAVTGKTEAINNTATAKASRATGSGYTNSTTLMYSIQLFTTMASSVDVDQIGSNSTLKALSQESFSNI